VDIHGVHNWDRQGRAALNLSAALAGDGITQADLERVACVTCESSPVSSVATWKSPVLLIHADDDRNVEFHQTVDLEQRLLEKGVRSSTAGCSGEPPRRPDDVVGVLHSERNATIGSTRIARLAGR
jgi:hypothetical protein